MTRTAVIIGAGPAGLTAALEMLRRTDLRPIVFEQDDQVGGISRTVNYRGNRMDLGGHRFFSKSDWVMNWWQQILPVAGEPADDAALTLAYQGDTRAFTPAGATDASADAVMLVRSRLSRIYFRRKFFDYPIRLSAATLRNLGFTDTLGIGLSYARAQVLKRTPERTLEDFMINRFGERLYRTFFKSYTEKVWGVNCSEISAEWGAQRIKGLSVASALAHAARSMVRSRADLAQRDTETSLIERFLYPKFGPGQLWEEVANRVVAAGGELHLRHRVVDVRREGPRITGVVVRNVATGDVRFQPCDELLSTQPLATLVDQLRPDDAALHRSAVALPYRDFMTVGLLLRHMKGGRAAPPDNWIYVQEPDVRLGRLQIFNNWSPHLVRDPNTVWLGLEYFCSQDDDLWSTPDPTFIDFAARELEQIGLADRSDVLDGTVVRVPKAYPAYFGEYSQIGRIREWLGQFPNLHPIGRNGMHRYNNQDHSMLAAKLTVDGLAAGAVDREALWALNTESDYHEERSAAASDVELQDAA